MANEKDTDATFAVLERRMREQEIPPLAIEAFRRLYNRLRVGEAGAIREEDIEPVEQVPGLDELASYEKRGEAVLSRSVVIKLNGGLGTSMGLEKAKSLLPVRGNLTFLDLIARQVLHLRDAWEIRLPLLLMNSFNTEGDSLAKLNDYPDLGAGQGSLPLSFLQNRVPKILQDNLVPVEWPRDPAKEWCPPGHGDIYVTLVTSGLLDRLIEQGFQYAFVSNADNLGAVVDRTILGFVDAEKVPFLMEVADRTPADRKGGHLARARDGRLILRESAQCPEDEMDAFQDIGRHRYFNTNNLWIDLRVLQEKLRANDNLLELPLIRNSKHVDPTDPSSPAVYQLETAMGAAIGLFPDAQALRVPRTRFAPVKTTDQLLALWSDLYRVTDAAEVIPNPEREIGPIQIELDADYYRNIDDFQARFPYGAPSLLRCARLTIKGDVKFGSDVVLEGDVEITNGEQRPKLIEDGTRISS